MPSIFESSSLVYNHFALNSILHTQTPSINLLLKHIEQSSIQANQQSTKQFYYFEVKKMNRPGDWNCRSCQHHNFQRRDTCQRCGDSKPGDNYGGFGNRVGSALGFNTGPDVRPGDWYCPVGNCGAHNFASRSSCYKCGAFKDELGGGGGGGGFDSELSRARGFGFGGTGGGAGGRSGWKAGDWICTRLGCNEHNFASRMECFSCNAPRESSSKSSYYD